ncbi:DegT/DnrJ/EryC1/StrS family aminotransferase [Thiospirochaeta perfilievii]|uniref:DegT/DnrJ/EryC1/StrS family aminotransferase n=1 Tax=Thiospirochaeta perfilievii TaxID=252967 RepID=A0A5C1QBX4_9SPIO|nr:DegT/DnrJ/EryC1/StrS family aminotransferase [Thiospirochaeta perfilievii]QEN05573.1 DegT/DnrJ/EryC1/StrS family aminotransferase [Thiospirochaeta perfilievii]
MSIKFSPPDISEEEIEAITETLRSGWITTGPKTRELEELVTDYTNSKGAVCLNSATAGMEMVLRLFDIGPGDEVITTPYTYSATAAVILHVGATPVFADVKKDSFIIDPKEIERKITSKTKAIIPVDIAGYPADYDEIFKIVRNNRVFRPKKGSYQEKLGRILVLADAAHSIGAKYKGNSIGSVADFSSFSFHAVKNVTTSEGGVVTFTNLDSRLDTNSVYKELRTLSLHGQSKDAINKIKPGSWEYDILFPGYKCNMTDLAASLGVVQLKRYRSSLSNLREEFFNLYSKKLSRDSRFILPKYIDEAEGTKSSCHLYQLRIKGLTEQERNRVILDLANKGIPLNVHYKPLPLLTCYKDLGYKMEDYPNAYNQYKNQVTLPLHTLLTRDDIELITKTLLSI